MQPVRQPIKAPTLEPEATSDIEQMSEEEFDLEPEATVEQSPSLTRTILNAISEEVESELEDSTPVSDETPDFSEIVKTSRGPPGGGRLIRDATPAKPASGPPTRGPPGLAKTQVEEAKKDTLTPIQRPVLQPAVRSVLTPVRAPVNQESPDDERTVLKPVTRAVLKPISTPISDEEE